MSTAFPNESREYREAREALLQREADLQQLMESVAAQRKSLPPGGEVPEDYVFDRIGDDGAATTVRMCQGPHRASSGVRTRQGVATHPGAVGGELQFSE
ncbi:DUF899 family protein [Nocardia sp. NPDC059246]|uniref:DUF899 family protein n=1 Tax=unclassified Nocardia TaxID=2637762 RepID=UPI00369950EF